MFAKFQQKIIFPDFMNNFLKKINLADLGIIFSSLIISSILFKILKDFFHKKIVIDSIQIIEKLDFESLKAGSLFFSNSLIVGLFFNYSFLSFSYLIFTSILVYFFWKKRKWSSIDTLKTERVLIVITLLIIEWSPLFSGFNYFTNQWYLFDRILLLILALLTYYSPLFLLLNIPILFLFYASFDFPFNSFSYTDKLLPMSIILFTLSSYFIVGVFKSRVKDYNRILLMGFLIIQCCSYFAPFLNKVLISPNYFDWFLIEDFHLAVKRYLAQGWIFDADITNLIGLFLVRHQKTLLLLAFITEFLGIFLFFRWKLSIIIISLFTITNIVIFLFSGVFFWKWIIWNILFVVYIFIKSPKINLKPLFPLILFILFISFKSPLFPKLGWYSTPYKLYYNIEVVDIDGNNKIVQGKDIAPFDIFFTFNRWNVFNKKQLPSSSSNGDEVLKLESMSLIELKKYQTNFGVKKYDNENLKILELFFKEYFKNVNSIIKPARLPFSAPTHIQTRYKDPFSFDKKVKIVRIYANEFWFLDDNIETKKHLIKEIQI